jgi:nicotinate-nucleotide adenylyltransferase
VAVAGILGGVFDPPHNGHVSLARAAISELLLDELLVLVVADPGHKQATTPADIRLELAQLAFDDIPAARVALDRHARTVDSLEERRMPTDTYFILGADELAGFESWKSPLRVLELVRVAVAMRPGVARDAVEAVRERLGVPGRIVEFEIDPLPISSSDIRARVRDGQAIDDLVPASIAEAITRLGLYGQPE